MKILDFSPVMSSHGCLYTSLVEGVHREVRPVMEYFLKGVEVKRIDTEGENTRVWFKAPLQFDPTVQVGDHHQVFEAVSEPRQQQFITASIPVIPLATPSFETTSSEVATDVEVTSAQVKVDIPRFFMKPGMVK